MTLDDILKHYRALIIVVAAGGLGGALMALVQSPTYVSAMTISAVSADEASIPSNSLVGAIGGSSVLRAIGGLTGARDVEESDFAYFVALLQSDRVLRKLIAKPEVAQELFKGEWDPETRTWHRKPGIVPALSALYKRMFFGLTYQPPNPARAKRVLARRFNVAFDLERNIYSLRMKHRQCGMATDLLKEVFNASDAVMKAEKRARYQQNIDLLQGELASPSNTSIRSEIANTLLNQQMRKIATESNFPIVARVIDGPGCEDRPYLPRPIPYTIGGALAGLVAMLAFLAWRAWRQGESDQHRENAAA
jgi:hypothetical protein